MRGGVWSRVVCLIGGCLVRGGAWPQGGLLLGGGAWSWGVPDPRGVGIPACTEAHPPGETAIAADGTHPTGMHSCLRNEGTDERQTALQI